MKFHLMLALIGALLITPVSTVAADTGDTSPRFDINRFDVHGNTLLSTQSIDELTKPFVGKQRDFADIMQAVEELEAAYHARGYQLIRVDLPEQELDSGVVVLNVVQTRIGQVTVEGNEHFATANIRNALPALREGETPDITAISKSLKLANENPAKRTVLKMKSGTQDDAVDATLSVVDEPTWTTTINLDNTGSASTGRTHAGILLQNANMFGLDHVLSLQYTTTLEKPSSVSVYGIGYHVPLYELGDSMDFFGSYSDVNSGTVTAGIFDIAVSGKGSVIGTRYNHNLATAGNYASKLVYGIDYKAYKNSMLLLGTELGNDITVHPLNVAYQGIWTLAAGEASFSATLLHNIPGGSRGSQEYFTAARAGAADDYTMLRFAASVTQALQGDWLVRAIVNGQYTRNALVPGEQFGAGGASSVRGFAEREVANDSGTAGSFEVYSPPLCQDGIWQCRVLAFYDSAYVARNHALPAEIRSTSLSSTGIGVRAQLRKDVDLQMDYGHVLHAEATNTKAGDNRLHVRLGVSF
jgi:hemolysin activation/secretion protein